MLNVREESKSSELTAPRLRNATRLRLGLHVQQALRVSPFY